MKLLNSEKLSLFLLIWGIPKIPGLPVSLKQHWPNIRSCWSWTPMRDTGRQAMYHLSSSSISNEGVQVLVSSTVIKPLGFQRKAWILRFRMSRQGLEEGMSYGSDRMMKKEDAFQGRSFVSKKESILSFFKFGMRRTGRKRKGEL